MRATCACWFSAMVAALALASCGGGGGKAAGTEGGPCFTNLTCNTGLTCASNLCVRLTGGGGSGGSGQAGSGVAGTSGQAGGGVAGAGAQAGSGVAGAGGQAGNGVAGASGQAGSGTAGAGGQAGSSAAGSSGQAGAGGAGGQGPGSYTIHWGPVQVAAGAEDTQCVTVRLGNVPAIHIGKIRSQLGAGTVQMVLYAVTDTTEQTTPVDCAAFTGVYQASKMATMTALTVVQNPDETLTFPTGVGVALAANQMMRIELHYSNPSAAAAPAEATVTLSTIPDASFQTAASLLTVSETGFSVPLGTSSIGPTFFPFPSTFVGAKFFAVTSEQHQLGTQVRVWSATSSTDTGTLGYQNTNPAMPPLTNNPSPAAVTTGEGFKYECDWNNTGVAPASFGLNASQELCVVIGYYYPSQGPVTCFHSANQFICCPGGGGVCN